MVLSFSKIQFFFNDNRSMVNGALFSVFSFVNRGFSFLLLLILANYIAPIEYGYLSLFTTVMMLIGYFIAFSTEGYFSLSYLKDGEESSKIVFTNIFATSLFVFLLLLMLLFLGGNYFSEKANIPLTCLYWAVIIVFFGVFININLEYFRVKEDVKTYGFFSCGNAILNFVTTILLVKVLKEGWEGRVYALALCSCIYGIYAIIFFMKKHYFSRIDPHVLKTMLYWGIPLIPHLATNFIKQGCDRYIINYYHNTADVGIFSFALNLTSLITMIGFGFNQSNSVSIYKVFSDKTINNASKLIILRHQRKRYIILYALSSFAVILGCTLFVPFLLPNYIDSLSYLPLLGFYGFGVCFYLIYTNYLFYFSKTKELMLITFSAAIVHLLISLILTKYSLYYTSFIYCISQLIIVFFARKVALNTIRLKIN